MLAEPQPPTVTSGRKPGKSAAERKRLQRLRERETAPIFYSTPDWRVFTSWQTLQQKAGCQPDKLRKIIIKELVDNALDAGANVSLEFVDGTWMITDDGAGLDPDDVPHLFCVNRSLQSTKLRRMPLRGMLGNGLRVVMGAVAASNETVVVETRGHRLTLRVCSDTGHTLVVSDQVRPHTPGVTVFLTYTNADTDDGNFARSSIAMAKVGKHYTGPSSPWWYGPDDLYHLFKAVTPPDTTVGALCDSLGLSLDDDRSAQTLNLMDAELVLNKLRNAARPISPEELGYLGRGIKPGEHARQNGIHVTTSGAKIPYVVEAWATCNRSPYKGYGDIYIQTILNRSHTLAQITAEWRSHSIHISGCGLNQSIKTYLLNPAE
jgi:hypothetical protein